MSNGLQFMKSQKSAPPFDGVDRAKDFAQNILIRWVIL